MAARDVTLGGETYRIGAFNGRKALIAGDAVAVLLEQAPEIINRAASFAEEYRESHVVRITRGMAGLPEFQEALAKIDAETWERLGNVIERPEEPNDGQVAAAVFPIAWRSAQPEVLRLIGLLLISNEKLAGVAREGDVDVVEKALVDEANDIVDSASIAELVKFAATAAAVLREELSEDEELREALGKLGREASRLLPGGGPGEDLTDEIGSSETTPTSSTPSPPPTGGAPTAPSTASRGESLSSSAPG